MFLCFWQPVLLGKYQKAQIPCITFFVLENIWHLNFIWKWPNSQGIVNFVPVYFGFLGTQNSNKIHNFLQIRFTSSKIMISYVFYYENGGLDRIWAFWHFSGKIGRQNYSVWYSGTKCLAASVAWCLFLKNNANILNQTVRLQCFLC